MQKIFVFQSSSLFYLVRLCVFSADRPAVRRGPPYPQWGSPDRTHYEFRGVPFRGRGAMGYQSARGTWFVRRNLANNTTRLPRRRPVFSSRSRSRSRSRSSRSRTRSRTRTSSRSHSAETGTHIRKRDVSHDLFLLAFITLLLATRDC